VTRSLKKAAKLLHCKRLLGLSHESEFATELRLEMQRQKCTALVLAAEMRVSPSFLSDIMSGRRKVSDGLLKRIMEG
jgi:predicted transcriptional regulator